MMNKLQLITLPQILAICGGLLLFIFLINIFYNETSKLIFKIIFQLTLLYITNQLNILLINQYSLLWRKILIFTIFFPINFFLIKNILRKISTLFLYKNFYKKILEKWDSTNPITGYQIAEYLNIPSTQISGLKYIRNRKEKDISEKIIYTLVLNEKIGINELNSFILLNATFLKKISKKVN